MDDISKFKNRFQKNKMLLTKFIYEDKSKFKSILMNTSVVIILTLVFNFLYERNEFAQNFYLLLLIYVCAVQAWWWYLSYVQRKKILESIPQFLSLLVMTMGMGKSFRFAFEKVMERQKSPMHDFYHEVFEKIFALREQKSCFGVQKLDTFYEFLYELSQKQVYQIQSLKNFQEYWRLQNQNERRRQYIMLPVWTQAVVLCLLYVAVQVWNSINGTLIWSDLVISGAWYVVGLCILLKQQLLNDRRV